MIGLVLVTHAGLASALVRSAEMIIGPVEHCAQVEVVPDEHSDLIMSRVVTAVESMSADGAIIMTDLFGGTPSNMAMSFLKDEHIEVLTGVNLPMVIEFFSKRKNMKITELTAALQTCGKDAILIPGEFLK